MRFSTGYFRVLFSLVVLLPVIPHVNAQSVSITPGYSDLGVSASLQYTAAVTGLSNTAVTWSVGGSGAQIGTITTAGLYTAPSAVPSGNVTINALASDKKTTSVVYVNIAPVGPAINSVGSGPIPIGSYSVTVSGTSFVSSTSVSAAGVTLSTTYVNSSTLTVNGWQGSVGTVNFQAKSPGTLPGPSANANIQLVPPQVITPGDVSVGLGLTQQFTSANAASWAASAGTVTSSGLYTAPTLLPSSGTDTITATGPYEVASIVVPIIPPTPTITSVNNTQLPQGICTTVLTGTGFISQSTVQLNGAPLGTVANGNSLSASGFCNQAGAANLTVTNGSIVSAAFPVQVGVSNPLASTAAARRFLEQAAFGPTITEATRVQTLGLPGWITDQFNAPQVSNYNSITSSQGNMPAHFLTMAVNNQDQLRQRIAFALSQLFVTSLGKLIWNDNMINFQNMLLADSFTNFRQIMGDVTISPAMGQYLDMANNAKANPAIGSLANENYARELMQLFTLGTNLLNQDGSTQLDSNGLPIPTYSQFTVTEFARVDTGWTYSPVPGNAVAWGNGTYSYTGPLIAYQPQHDFGSKQLLNGYVSPAGATPRQDLDNALDNIFNHPNVDPFFGRQLIQHLVKSNPSPAYIARVAAAFNNNGNQVRGDMRATIAAVLLDPEARANDEGGNDLASDGHLQEPALFIAGMVRAFGGQMNDQNYYTGDLAAMGEDIFSSPSVFNYYAPTYLIPGTTAAAAEFQIYTPNAAIVRSNEVFTLFNQSSHSLLTYGPGTSIDLSPFLPLAATPAALVDALDFTLTHGVMPSAMETNIVNAVAADTGGSLERVQVGAYLILTSGYYNVWH